ncbi:MAG: cation:proton antiporter [Erysipelotrichaceae bacterium]|jgi:NhaP-type Na+/H+ or K+/H+ antiporter|nr:sodium:proton antiporter [Erysipelotrichaceae bacterium]
MLISIAYILLLGLLFGYICKLLKLPSLIGMIVLGVLIGPSVFNLIDSSILNISSELRRIALIIILIRAGLNLDIKDLIKVGRPAMLMSFLPACFEIIGMVLISTKVFSFSFLDGALLGSVIAAVSPAVVVPSMLRIMEEGYGTNKSIPQLILAGASVDDIFVIVLFYTFIGLSIGNSVSLFSFIKVPVSIFIGILIGILVGYILFKYFDKVHIRDTLKVIIMLCVSFVLVTLEDKGLISFSALISIMVIGIVILKMKEKLAIRLSLKFNKLWVVAEVFLFVLVGASVDINFAFTQGIKPLIVIIFSLVFRMVGVLICLIKTDLNIKERLFCMIAYTPKATVQAAIGGIALSMGIASGNIILTVAVVSILFTAPLGAFFINLTYKKLLIKDII